MRAISWSLATRLLKSTKISAIGPETKAPTETERTGLTVPVELTTVSTRPRVTLAVTNFGADRCAHQERAGMTTAAAIPASTPRTISHRSNRRMRLPPGVRSDRKTGRGLRTRTACADEQDQTE